jgi:Trypsin-like peptidase domain
VAIGSPLGLEGTVSDGIVSALRSEANKSWIQTTAPVSHGNSGGPLLDMRGNVVGVITSGISAQKGQNLNFAIPSDDVKTLLSTHGDLASIEVAGKKRSGDGEETDSSPDAGEQHASEQLRAIAEAIKKCPKYKGLVPHLYGSESRDGPPINVVWNIEPSSSVRARFSGTLEYEVPWWINPGVHPEDLCASEEGKTTDCYSSWKSMFQLYERMKANPQHYRYEFDVTPRGLEYSRGFDKLHQLEDEPWAAAEDLEKCASWAMSSVLSNSGTSQ